ncbi:MAG TPA: methyltransferase domain-containing protein [Acidimicrobiales bacterium]|nr:methyltransferase domain-containing protein [Acidimicrobiales bacterium]
MERVAVANAEMAAAWDGPEGDHWAQHAERYERAGWRYWKRFLEAVRIQGGDSVLDIGCGTGKSTRDAARLAGPGSVLGVDLSARMLERAQAAAQAEGLTNVRFEQADAQVHPFPDGAFDVAISSFGAMFFADPTAAFTNIARALRPEGRLALLTWRELAGNEWVTAIRDAVAAGRALPEPPADAPGPFGLARADHVRRILGAAGMVDVHLDAVYEPVEFGVDAEDAFAFVGTTGFTKGLTQDLDEESRARAFDALRRTIIDHETDHGVLFGSSAWLVTARAPRRLS